MFNGVTRVAGDVNYLVRPLNLHSAGRRSQGRGPTSWPRDPEGLSTGVTRANRTANRTAGSDRWPLRTLHTRGRLSVRHHSRRRQEKEFLPSAGLPK
ncbi:hypothetical protein SKAU_G00083730 [Synaphobranchus kaupii]|uniref:Uncharacterized protein n=1 Tax=Synaphobranchus kaupii TaxID=118154 RepID=A0A9Q1FVB2_SYNKA|nr:hypothetical protein SKAU_G00083730 [Synaphobranchus kaupii]